MDTIISLTNRIFTVIINGAHNEQIDNMFGVQQGSILGTFLSILYVDEINNLSVEFGMNIYL